MDIIQVVDSLTEEMYQRFKCAVETGKWPEGTVVDQEQRETAMQIVLAYQARRLNSEDIMTVGADGQIVTKSKSALKEQFNQKDTIARFNDL